MSDETQPPLYFVCAAHEDRGLVEKIEAKLGARMRRSELVLWVDRRNLAWREPIARETIDLLTRASGAIVLVSESWFASDFIQSSEWPMVRDRNERDPSFGVFLLAVTDLDTDDPLRSRTFVNDLQDELLMGSSEAVRDVMLTRLSSQLGEHARSVGLNARRPAAAAETDIGFAYDIVRERRWVSEEDDLLDIEDDVRTLCRLVLARSTRPPLAIGLFGDWGTGKSFFLQRMRSRMEEMAAEAASSAAGLTFCEQIVQVTFNAWHYVDADLWTSIANRLYREIAEGRSQDDILSRRVFEELRSTTAARSQAIADESDAKQELERVNDRLADLQPKLAKARWHRLTVGDATDVVAIAIGDTELATDAAKELREVVADARFGTGMVRALIRGTSGRAKATAAVAVVLAVTTVALVSVASWLPAVIALGSSAVAAVGAWVTGFKNALRKIRKQADDARALLDDADAALHTEAAELERLRDEATVKRETAETALSEIRDGSLVRRYLDERLRTAAYHERVGLISLVREDLERLTDVLDSDSTEFIDAKLERIVLYIDDLDRCPPSRVVEVLQAIHLLLAFPLFVVVVAVDPRWLLTSLKLHYRELLRADRDGDATLHEYEITPANYLEKIFQIPLRLRPMSEDGYRRLVSGLAAPAGYLAAGDCRHRMARPRGRRHLRRPATLESARTHMILADP